METSIRNIWSAWISETEKIVSFHPVEGYQLVRFPSQGLFHCEILAMANEGYRFQ